VNTYVVLLRKRLGLCPRPPVLFSWDEYILRHAVVDDIAMFFQPNETKQDALWLSQISSKISNCDRRFCAQPPNVTHESKFRIGKR